MGRWAGTVPATTMTLELPRFGQLVSFFVSYSAYVHSLGTFSWKVPVY